MPYRLPPDTGDFTGRSGAVAELTGALTSGRCVPVAAVGGMGGVGKTTLAVHVAHLLRQRFRGGRLYVNLRGMADRPAEPYAVLGGLLRALGRSDVPDAPEERAALYRSELAGRRMLVLLDDARCPAQVGPLLPGAPGSAVLVTSRTTMAGLPGARHLDLDVLEPDEAMALLTSVAGAGRVAAERGAALDLVAACGFLPLAIRGAGAWLAARPALGIGVLARHLMCGRVEELPSAVACFRLGYDLLGREEARAFRLLALADGPGFSTGAAGAALGLRRQHADDLLQTLADLSLVECLAPDRYRFHDLLRLFALGRAARSGERLPALRGLLEHYLAAAHAAAAVLGGTGPSAFGTPDAARTWLFVEQDAILTAVERAAEEPGGPLVQAADLLLALTRLLDREWRSGRLRNAAFAVRAAACRRDDALARVKADRALGCVDPAVPEPRRTDPYA
ncbi:NB-ARC domain-containing protein [Actinomadura sp. DC4]|uniref:NB-ARC domain-containing protein n=1 Tax=Actinomadura sp. DC4 TaxID=3055069 RepID=UPI0025AFE08C|nr:NB-ARC domain-containing protein [Actinomadura sp. DC4]MDN3351273.1 NB-ARC domain-containing protein [Actinomadura sp. DC4]